jgi:hypothetical protein
MTTSSELFNDGELNLFEAKLRILKNIVLQRRIGPYGTLIDILHPYIDLFKKKRILYVPEYKLKASFFDSGEPELEVGVVEEPSEEWDIVPIDTPILSRSSDASFHVINGALYLCIFRDFQTLNKDLEIEVGCKYDSAIKIDIVNKTFECIDYRGEVAPTNLLDAGRKMFGHGSFLANVGGIHSEVSSEREKNEAFDKACQECCLYDMLNKTNVYETLFLLNVYIVSPAEVKCLYENAYGSAVLTGFLDACRFDSLTEPEEVMAAFKQLFGKGDTIEEVLGTTKEELNDLRRCAPRARDKMSLDWIRFIQEKKGLPIPRRIV